ncbi:MAG: hypothetical protein FWE21_01890 [Defluviitaleaceae bacterium]|nr:hypothetical protein [Defluviitaleaceae bacterium]
MGRSTNKRESRAWAHDSLLAKVESCNFDPFYLVPLATTFLTLSLYGLLILDLQIAVQNLNLLKIYRVKSKSIPPQGDYHMAKNNSNTPIKNMSLNPTTVLTPFEIFKGTLPFVFIKLGLRLLFVALLTLIIALLVRGFISMQHITASWYCWTNWDTWTNFGSHALWGIFLAVVVLPLLGFIFKRYLRFMFRVGHISVIVRAVNFNSIPDYQVAYGMERVKKKFAKANIFFVIDKMVHRALVELQPMMNSATSSLGFLALPVRAFKGKLLRHVDDCCLAFTFLREDISPLRASVLGVISYVRGWRAMAKQAALATLYSFLVSLAFYVMGFIWLYNGVMSGSSDMITSAVVFILVMGAVKRCILDSYVMTVMVAAFLREIANHGIADNWMAGDAPLIAEMSHVSTGFRKLVAQSSLATQSNLGFSTTPDPNQKPTR